LIHNIQIKKNLLEYVFLSPSNKLSDIKTKKNFADLMIQRTNTIVLNSIRMGQIGLKNML